MNELRLINTGKIDACPNLRIPKFWHKTGVGNVFLKKLRNARETRSDASSRRKKNETMVFNRSLPVARSKVFPRQSTTQLSAPDGEIP
jgi:hypothetical protein